MKPLTEDQKRRIEAIKNEAERQTDSFLKRIIKSKWSWAIVLVILFGTLAAAVLMGLLFQ